MRYLVDKTAVITGGAGGLGREVGLRLARAGAKVALWDLDKERLDETVEDLRKKGGEVRGYVLDASDRTEVFKAAERVRSDFGEVDILDNNAGVILPGELAEISEDAVHTTIDVNLKSYVWCAQAFLPGMIERGSGHIVMTASAAGMTGVPKLAAYSASKHGVVGLAESLRLELRAAGVKGVGLTIVCPSYISTGMFEGVKPPRLTPWLTPDYLADKIIAAVRKNRVYVREPFMVKLLPLLKALPSVFLLDFLGDILGLHTSMETFKGKPKGGSS